MVVWRCAVPTPLRRYLDYLPATSAGSPLEFPPEEAAPGCRVSVPLGRRSVVAIIVEIRSDSEVPTDKLRPAEALLDAAPLLTREHLRLMQWVAHYYIHPPGEVMPLALAPRERRGEPPLDTGQPGLRLSARGLGLPPGALGRAPRQAALIALLQEQATTLEACKAAGISSAVIRELLKKELIERCQLDAEHSWTANLPLEPSNEQLDAIERIAASLGRFQCHLLQGITGSGKTEVYLQAIAATLAQGQQALVMLPEIALTPQMTERFQARFNAPVVELHSGLSDGIRDRHWSMARQGQAAVVIGTRSAVFAPISNLGLIVVDEEHETSFVQMDGLRYSARDVAIKRGQIHSCPVVLGSATPSLETLDNAVRGRFSLSKLASRAGGAQLPKRDIIDIRALDLTGGLSQPLLEAITATLERDEQVLLFLNRRGFAPALTCHDCGWTAECAHCDARPTIHRRPSRLLCHHCGAGSALPLQCPSCGSRRLMAAGIGTEQTEQVLKEHFAAYPVYRVDSDSMRTQSDMTTLRQTLAGERASILIGTQMLAKGHDFPKVTLAGVVDADALLFSPDFRGEERLAQLLTQVSGRAGRGLHPGQVLIQTRHPDHPLIRGLLESDYETMAHSMLEERALRGLPPTGALALIRADSRDTGQGMTFLQTLANTIDKQALSGCRLVGPLGAPMARRAGLTRTQLVIAGPDRATVGRATRALVATAETIKPPAGLRWFTDVDPVDAI